MEHVLVFRKPGRKRKIPRQDELMKSDHSSIVKAELEEWLNPVWDITSPVTKNHPATFPVELARRIIRLYSLENDVILDPFVGSGTTFQVALSLQRTAIGYENNSDYVHLLATEFNLKEVSVGHYLMI